MSLLNIVKIFHSFRPKNEKDKKIKEIEKEMDEISNYSDHILSSGIVMSEETNHKINSLIDKEMKENNHKIRSLRDNILSSKMLISKEQCYYPFYQKEENEIKKEIIDIQTIVGMSPRVEVDNLKDVADKLGYCIFDEAYFAETNEAPNQYIANATASYLKTKGYKIYYVSPISAFNYDELIKGNANIYDKMSYWGIHLPTYNALVLSLNAFRDVYANIEALRKENEEIRKAISADRTVFNAFQNQFKEYVSHVYNNFRLLEAPIKDLIDKKNKEFQVSFNEELKRVTKHNEKYINNPYEKVEYYKMYDSETKEYLGETCQMDIFNDGDIIYQKGVFYRYQLLPVPEKAYQYENFYASKFDVKNLKNEQEIKKFKANYTLANIKKLVRNELCNNYLMVAIKGDVLNPELTDAIVLSSWGEGISEETMVAIGIEND